MMLGQDYSNLENEFKQYEVKVDESEILEFNDIDSTIDESSDKTITQSVKDVFDPDKAFDELMSATKDRDDVFTRAMRNRSKAVESIIEEEYDGKPIK
jgi:GTPase involved in cell partitioning and DNA repair